MTWQLFFEFIVSILAGVVIGAVATPIVWSVMQHFRDED